MFRRWIELGCDRLRIFLGLCVLVSSVGNFAFLGRYLFDAPFGVSNFMHKLGNRFNGSSLPRGGGSVAVGMANQFTGSLVLEKIK